MSTLNVPAEQIVRETGNGSDALRELDDPRTAPSAEAPTAAESTAAAPAGQPSVDENGPAWLPEKRPLRAEPQGGKLSRLYDKVEAFVSRLSVRDNFWHRICSLIWLPYAFFSGIRMKAVDANTFAAVLPFRRFNRNWYHAMAGGALLANSEIAGGMYLFGVCGGDYTVVCKKLTYTFLRPCFGPALYQMSPRDNIKSLIATGTEFNITVDLEILQQVSKPGERDKRVGRCEATFHVTPKVHHKLKKARGR